MIKAVIFDLDNTLVDFMAMKNQAVDAAIHAMRDAGLQLSHDEVRKRIDAIYAERGIEFQSVFDQLLFDEFSKLDYKLLAVGIIAYRRAREAALVLYPHVYLTLIELMKMNLKLAVVSDAPGKEAWLRLCYLNLHHLFDVVVTYDDTKTRKPNREPFEAALKRLGVRPEDALMVGDWAERDVLGAAQVGMKTIFARYGDTFGTVVSHADYEIDDVTQIVDIVRQLNREK
jgi:putative hydrolase of the HAD superfamily